MTFWLFSAKCRPLSGQFFCGHYHIAFILELWSHLSVPQTWLAHHHSLVIFHWMLASGWFFSGHYLCNHSSYWFHIGTLNSHKWQSHRITIPSCSSDVSECSPLIGWFISCHYLCNHSSFAVMLEMWTHLSDPQTWLVYCNAQRSLHPKRHIPHSQCIEDTSFSMRPKISFVSSLLS